MNLAYYSLIFFGHFWLLFFGTLGLFCLFSAVLGQFGLLRAMFGLLWLPLATISPHWPLLAIPYGLLSAFGLVLAAFGHFWTFLTALAVLGVILTAFGLLWLPLTTFGCAAFEGFRHLFSAIVRDSKSLLPVLLVNIATLSLCSNKARDYLPSIDAASNTIPIRHPLQTFAHSSTASTTMLHPLQNCVHSSTVSTPVLHSLQYSTHSSLYPVQYCILGFG